MELNVEKLLNLMPQDFNRLIEDLQRKMESLKPDQLDIFEIIATGWRQEIDEYKATHSPSQEDLARLEEILKIVA